MTWTATVVSTDNTNGNLLIGVSYSNGIQTFSESLSMNSANQTILTKSIQNRLATLDSNDALVSLITPAIKTGTLIITSSVQSVSI